MDMTSPVWTVLYVRRERTINWYSFVHTAFLMTDCTHRCQSLLYVLIRCKIFRRPQQSGSPVLKHIFRQLRCRLPKHFQPTSTKRDFQYHTGLERERMGLGWAMYDPQKPLRVKVYNSTPKFSYLVTASKKQYCPSRVNFTVRVFQ